MACTSMSISSSSIAAATKDIMRDQQNSNTLRRSQSGNDLYNGSRIIRRSYSESHLSYRINNRIHASSTQPKLKNSRSAGKFPFQLSSSILPNAVRSFLFDPETSKDVKIMEDTDEVRVEVVEEEEEDEEEERDEVEEGNVDKKRANWMERLLEIRSHWRNRQQGEGGDEDGVCDVLDEYGGDEGVCEVDYNDDEEEEDGRSATYNQESFSKFLVEVDWSDTKLFSQLAFLCNMAYAIPEIKSKDLRRYYRLRFVTSSLEKKEVAAALKEKLEQLEQDSTLVPVAASAGPESSSEKIIELEKKHLIRPSVAYKIAASAASYVQSHAKGLLSLGSEPQQEEGSNDMESCRNNGDCPKEEGESSPSRVCKPEVAAYVAASTMTAVVAAGEKAKQQAARDLRSLHSSPCEWFVCDDYSTYTRCFVIQGSDSLASWQANLFFEPTKFEGTDVLVHRGIYEAAKGIYEQFMPEIVEHLNTFGDRAKLQFTGHSLGGSLALLVNLMLLTRKVLKPSALRPVVTFGSPFVFCGGQKILEELGLDQNHVHCVMMHRDVVPRAFSCKYPNHVAQLLKRLSGTFRSHPCLNKNKLLYSPMGKMFILQPDEKSSPPHPFLPPRSALYCLDKTICGSATNALMAFLNSPHPLETLSDPTAYGSDGTILRDHDSSNYLKAVNGVLREHTKMVVRSVRKQRNLLWPLLTSPSPNTWSHKVDLENKRLLTSPSPNTWSHKVDLENTRLLSKEVMT